MKVEKRFLCTIDEEDGELVTLRVAPVDLCALLRLADELEEDACWEVQSPGVDNRAWMLKDACDRIREALGVDEDE